MLSIVPVKVRCRKGGRSIETYAFMDPGSTTTFCTEELQKKLNVKGKLTQILLSTMGQEEHVGQKLISSYMLSDLEVCGLEDTKYIQLPKVFSHTNIPVQKENIPSQQQLQRWPYLNEVSLPHIDADVGLLIGANNSKAMEPWHIINSQDDGPYTVKTILGWMVCGSVKNESIISTDKTTQYSVKRISVVEIEQLKAAETVLRNFYIDDCLKSAPTEEEAVALVKNLRDLCMEGGFNLTKWVSNSRKLLSSIPAEHRASELKDLDLTHNSLPTERALGVQWRTEDDTFAYSIKLQDKPMTRRGILSVVNSIYDPLGFLVLVVLPAKLLLRDLCKEKQGWDEEISGKQADQWCRWLEDLAHLSDFSIKRCVKPVGFGRTVEARLHHFADASENAYGTASYIVLVDEQGRTHCSFILGEV